MNQQRLSPAVFLDRDNTIIADPGYICQPSQVRLLPGAAAALKRLAQAGYKTVLVTNQSAIARGMLSEDGLHEIHQELRHQLAAGGATLDAIYCCPYHPEGIVPKYTRASDLRKPGAGMLLQAAGEMHLDLRRSWMVGDRLQDVQAGATAGCRTILVTQQPQGDENSPATEATRARPDYVVADLAQAADAILAHAQI